MGQAGSIEQRNAIRDVVTIKPASVAQDREAVVAALQAFCKMFPIEAAGSEAPLSNGEESGGNSGSLDVKESKLFFVMHALLQHATECTEKNSKEDLIGLTLTSIKRVILWRDLYRLGAKCSMKPFLNCLLLSPALARSALHVMLSLTGVCPGAESSEKTEKWETLNRRNFADSGGYDVLRSLLVEHGGGASKTVSTGDGDTVLTLVLEMFYSALVTRRHTSDISTTSLAVGALLNARIALLGYCHHTNSTVQEYAIDLVIELFFLIDLEQVHELQESAREYGALLYALTAVVSERKKHSISSDDGSSSGNTGDLTPTNSATTLQQRHLDLVEIFCAGNTRSKKVVSRIFPVELFIPLENRAELISRHTASSILKSTRNNRSLPSFTFDFELRSSVDNKRGRVGSLVGSGSKLSGGNGGAFDKWLQEARNQGEDWKKIVASLHDDHERPDLVWKSPMRNELRQALRAEIDKFEHLRDMAVVTNPGSTVRWEHDMFRVDYASMQKELVVNGYFVECLIPILADLSNQFEVVEPLVFAWHLTDRLAVEENELWRILCVRCLRLTVRRYAMVLQGQVPTRYILELLRHHSDHSQQFIRECFLLLNTAILTTRNAPSEILDNVSTSVAIAVVEVLSDSTLVSALSRSSQRGVEDDIDPAYDFDEERVIIRNGSDGLVRAGVSVLQTIIRRSKYTLQLIRPKRVFICRLLAVETLDHVTVNRILTILKQFVHLDSTGGILANTKVLHTVAKPAVDANWKALALVYILVACCDPNGRGMSAVAAEFLKENYCDTSHHQSADESPTLGSVSSSTDKSHLRRKQKKSEFNELLNDALGFDGCGIGSLLRSSEPRLFCDIFNAEVKKSADVWWGRRQRVRLFRYLKRKFVASSSDLPSNNQSEEGDEVVFPADLTGEDPTRLQDGSDDEIFVGNIFLRSYVEGDGEFLNEWTPGMYKSLIQALFVRLSELSRAKSVFGVSNGQQSPLRARAQPWEVQVLILKALIRLLPTHSAYVEIKSEFYDALLLPLRRSLLGDTDQIRGTLGLDLLIAILKVPPETSSNASTCCQYLGEKGLQTIAEALEKMMNSAYQQLLASATTQDPNHAHELLSRATELLITLSSHAEGAAAIEKNPSVVAALLSLSSKHYISSYSPLAVATCLDCLTKLCLQDNLRPVVISAGGLLYLLDICVFCPVGPGLVEPPPPAVDADEGNNSATSDAPRLELNEASFLPLPPLAFAVRSSAVTLQACLVDSQGEECTAFVQVLRQLLTPSFVRILRLSPERFVLRLQSTDDICTSTLIWTTSMRRRLRDTLAMELTKVKTAARSNVWPRWNPDHFIAADSFRYQYPELADELIVHDVYINKFVSSDGVAFEDIDMSAFSQALLISIQSGENVLRILQQRGASDPAKERSIVVMRLALNKLVTTHPQHNLQVDPTPPTSIGMTSLIENESSDESDDDDDTSTAGSSVGGFRVQNNESALERSSTLDDLTV